MSATTLRAPAAPGAEWLHEPERPGHGDDPVLPERELVRIGRLEELGVFVVFWVAYFIVGLHLVDTSHVIVFDSLDRATRAYMAWWDAPPKLAAIGFVFPPLQSVAYLPFTLVKPLATSLVVLPVVSAIFAALTMVSLNAIFVRCRMSLVVRLGMLVLFGINPLWIFYAANGMSEAMYAFLFTASIAAFIAWYLTEQSRFLIGAGLAIAVAALTRYDLALFSLFLGLLIVAVLVRRRSSGAKVEGSLIAFGAPIVYSLAIWTMFNWLIVGKPFSWLQSPQNLAVNSNQVAHHAGASFSALVSHAAQLTIHLAPLAVVAFVVLLIQFIGSRNTMALGLAAVIALTVLLLAIPAAFNNNVSDITMRSAIPIIVAGAIGGAWVSRSGGGMRIVAQVGMALLLVLAIPLTWSEMKKYPYQNLEQAFTRALFSGKDQTGTASRGGFIVGVRSEEQMADYINRLLGHRNHAVLTDNAQTYGVILLSGRAGTFFNRVDRGDKVWHSVLNDPSGRVQYLLVSNATGDLIRKRYPNAASGGNAPKLVPVYTTTGQRYTLIRVAPRTPALTGTPTQTTTTTTTTTSGP